MRNMLRVAAFSAAVLAPILVVQPASAAVTHHAGSCRISGDFATCVASGNATGGIKNIYAHVSASPNQSVDVSWSMVCVKGSGAASKSGSFTATTPIRRYLKMPFFRPRSCSVATSAQLSGSGSLHVWTPEMLLQAHQLGVQTFVNVLGPEDNRENLERAVRMGFDFIQTDHEAELRDLLNLKLAVEKDE